MLGRLISVVFLSSVVFVAGCASHSPEQKAPLSKKEIAVTVLQKLGTTDTSYLNYISDDQYIQHNLNAASGKQGLLAFLKLMKPREVGQSNAVRVFQDGQYVVVQSDVPSVNSIVFDIFRFHDGKIVEHWDNLQAKSTKPNASGHSQVDGPTKVVDLGKTERNKKLVKNFVQTALIDGKLNTIPSFVSSKTFVQHDPKMKDGLAGLRHAFAKEASSGKKSQYNKLEAVLGEGNFVLAVSRGEENGKPAAFYDLYRVANDKIVEHWSVDALIPPKDKQKNTNGKFNFPASVMK